MICALFGEDYSLAINNVQLEYRASFSQTDARSICSMINSFRTGHDAWYLDTDNTTKIYPAREAGLSSLDSLVYDYDLEKVAMQRAQEIAICYSHTRPNGGSFWTSYPENGYLLETEDVCGENIALGYESAEDVHIGWREDDEDYQGQGHRRNMLDPDYKAVGVGHVVYKGCDFWVEEFSSNVRNPFPTAAYNEAKTCLTKAAVSRIESVDFYNYREEYNIDLNMEDRISLPNVYVRVDLKDDLREWFCPLENKLSYRIEDESIAQIIDEEIVAKQQGQTNLILSFAGTEKKLPLTVCVSDTSRVHSDFNSGDYRTYEGKYGFYYRDDYFSEPATQYNQSLATMSLCMAMSTNNKGLSRKKSDTYVHELMKKCGFAGVNDANYEQCNFNVTPMALGIGCAIGSKYLEDGTTVIAVAVRGFGYDAEWADNFNVGLSGDHAGFNNAAGILVNQIKDYIARRNISGNVKIWITGYSRAGAAATQAAARLNKASIDGVTCPKENIYAYGFATPAGAAKESKPDSTAYNNIFSLVHYHDLVPKVAPEGWGFRRYGTTKMFPYNKFQKSLKITELGRSTASNYENAMRAYFEGLSEQEYRLDSYRGLLGKDWTFASIGSFNQELVNTVAASMGLAGKGIEARRIYKSQFQYPFTTAVERFMDEYDLPDDASVLLECTERLVNQPSTYGLVNNLISAEVITHYWERAINNSDLLVAAHEEPDYYLAWMQVMDPNYPGSLPTAFAAGSGRKIKVNCPVDVKVYDSDHMLVASIIDEEPVESGYDESEGDRSIEYFIDSNDQKTFILPIDEEYSFEIEPREACDISCRVQEFMDVSAEPTRIINYTAENVTETETLTSAVQAYPEEEVGEDLKEGSSAEYTLERNGETMECDAEYRGEEEIQNHSYTVTTKYDASMGTVVGAGTYPDGEFVKLTAESKAGYRFAGFYIDGTRVTDDDLDCNENTVRIKVTGDVEVNAEFQSGSCIGGHSWKHIKHPAGLLKIGSEYDQCTVCKIKRNAKKLNGYAKYYVKSLKVTKAKKSVTVKWKKQSKANQKKFNGYQIRYSMKSNMKNARTVKAGRTTSYKTIKKLKSKKKYYIQVRTSTKKNGIIFYSKWSAKRVIKTK